MNATRPYWWSVNIGSGNGLVPSGNKPLPEPMLTKIFVDHMVSLGPNELKQCQSIINWTIGNKLQWNFNRNQYIFIPENVYLKMLSVKWRPFCPKEDELNKELLVIWGALNEAKHVTSL